MIVDERKKQNFVFDPLVRDDKGRTLFHSACLKGYRSIAIWMIDNAKSFIHLSIQDHDGRTVFHDVCHHGDTYIVGKILDNAHNLKGNLSVKDRSNSWTGFQIACHMNHMNIVKMIIEKAEDIKLDLRSRDKLGMNEFHLACYHGQTLVVGELLKSLKFNLAKTNSLGSFS